MDGFVCGDCCRDACLAEFIKANAEWDTCSYCNETSDEPFSVEISTLATRLEESFSRDYTSDFDSEYPYDDEDDSYLGAEYTVRDILEDYGFEPKFEQILDDVCDCFFDTYAKVGTWSPTPPEYAMGLWDGFCKTVKHRRRFTFWDVDDKASYGYTSKEIIKRIVERLAGNGLIHHVPVGTALWRARIHDGTQKLKTADQFTSAPEAKAVTNRMSPAGIPMFYAAGSFATASFEVVGWHYSEADGDTVTGMSFEPIVDLDILDLTAIRHPRSWFEPWEEQEWNDYLFIRDFVNDVSKPIEKNGAQHIDYVPTQVFTEYVRYELRHNGELIHGMAYPSCYDGSKCLVIFATQEQCLPPKEFCRDRQLLRPMISTLKSVAAVDVKSQLDLLKKKMETARRWAPSTDDLS